MSYFSLSIKSGRSEIAAGLVNREPPSSRPSATAGRLDTASRQRTGHAAQ
jgi:hypothetical protein